MEKKLSTNQLNENVAKNSEHLVTWQFLLPLPRFHVPLQFFAYVQARTQIQGDKKKKRSQ